MLSHVSWALAHVAHVTTILPTAVTAPKAHPRRLGNRDENSYVCPDIYLLCFADKLGTLSLIRAFFLHPVVTCVLLDYDMKEGPGGLRSCAEGYIFMY